MRNLKIIGLAIMAVLALSAVAASGASAAEYMTGSTSGTSYFTVTQGGNQVFKAGSTVSCTGVTEEGSFAGTSATSIEAKEIKYTGCTVAGQAATIEMNGCNFTFDEPTGTSSPYGIPTIAIKCPTGKTIVIKATTSGCTITIGSQTLTGGSSTGTNEATSPAQVLLTASLGGITSTSTGGVCGTKGTTSTATYSGRQIFKAFSDLLHHLQVSISIIFK